MLLLLLVIAVYSHYFDDVVLLCTLTLASLQICIHHVIRGEWGHSSTVQSLLALPAFSETLLSQILARIDELLSLYGANLVWVQMATAGLVHQYRGLGDEVVLYDEFLWVDEV